MIAPPYHVACPACRADRGHACLGYSKLTAERLMTVPPHPQRQHAASLMKPK